MKALLQHKATRKKFLIIIGLILSIIILLRIFVFKSHDFEIIQFISSILDKAFISLFIALFLALFLFYIEVPEDEKKLEIVESSRLKEIFLKNYSQTDYWYFSGGTGRYMRYETINKLSEISNNKNEHINIKLILINPFDDNICEKYASFRESFEVDKTQTWTKSYVQNQIMATIISCIIYQNDNPLLDISIHLKNAFSMFRLDFNKKNCIITKEAKNEPAIVVTDQSFLYRTYKQEIFQSISQSTRINLAYTLNNYKIGHIKLSLIKEICQNFDLNRDLSKDDYKQIQTFININDKYYG